MRFLSLRSGGNDLIWRCLFGVSIIPEKAGCAVGRYAAAACAFQSGSPQYRQLEEAGRRLEEVIRQNKGLSNKELGKFTSQLQALISKWQRDNR